MNFDLKEIVLAIPSPTKGSITIMQRIKDLVFEKTCIEAHENALSTLAVNIDGTLIASACEGGE